MHLFIDLVYADLTSSTASYVAPLPFLYCDNDEFSKFYSINGFLFLNFRVN